MKQTIWMGALLLAVAAVSATCPSTNPNELVSADLHSTWYPQVNFVTGWAWGFQYNGFYMNTEAVALAPGSTYDSGINAIKYTTNMPDAVFVVSADTDEGVPFVEHTEILSAAMPGGTSATTDGTITSVSVCTAKNYAPVVEPPQQRCNKGGHCRPIKK